MTAPEARPAAGVARVARFAAVPAGVGTLPCADAEARRRGRRMPKAEQPHRAGESDPRRGRRSRAGPVPILRPSRTSSVPIVTLTSASRFGIVSPSVPPSRPEHQADGQIADGLAGQEQCDGPQDENQVHAVDWRSALNRIGRAGGQGLRRARSRVG